jgi:hypothetical protein
METQYQSKSLETGEELAQAGQFAHDLVSRMTRRATEIPASTPLVLHQHSPEADNLATYLGTNQGWNIQIARMALDSIINSPLVKVDKSGVRVSSQVPENVRSVVEETVSGLREWIGYDEYLAHGQRADGGFLALRKVGDRIVPAYVDRFTQTSQ